MFKRRVLLIDFDFGRASSLPDIKHTAKRDVVDLVLNNATASEVIQSVPELAIDYLPMNRCSFYPLLRFAAVELPRLTRTLHDRYDCVILNSPPVLGRTETRLLAALADDILFIVKWASTRREFAQNALSLLRDKPALSLRPQSPSVSAVVTQVDVKQHARYGYGDIGEYFSMDAKLSPRRRQAASPLACSSDPITRPAATISKGTRATSRS
jgi:cellulose biosynthesis protein BcsQ